MFWFLLCFRAGDGVGGQVSPEGWTSAEHSVWDQSLQTRRYKHNFPLSSQCQKKRACGAGIRSLNVSAQCLTPLIFWFKPGLLVPTLFDRSQVSLRFSRKWAPAGCSCLPGALLKMLDSLFSREFRAILSSFSHLLRWEIPARQDATVIFRLNRYKPVCCTGSVRM